MSDSVRSGSCLGSADLPPPASASRPRSQPCAEAIEYQPGERMFIHLDRLDDAVLSPDKKALIREVLAWYRGHHPLVVRLAADRVRVPYSQDGGVHR